MKHRHIKTVSRAVNRARRKRKMETIWFWAWRWTHETPKRKAWHSYRLTKLVEEMIL